MNVKSSKNFHRRARMLYEKIARETGSDKTRKYALGMADVRKRLEVKWNDIAFDIYLARRVDEICRNT